jgi:hypothetical protein
MVSSVKFVGYNKIRWSHISIIQRKIGRNGGLSCNSLEYTKLYSPPPLLLYYAADMTNTFLFFVSKNKRNILTATRGLLPRAVSICLRFTPFTPRKKSRYQAGTGRFTGCYPCTGLERGFEPNQGILILTTGITGYSKKVRRIRPGETLGGLLC